jgi:hypothetical protein
VVYNWAAVSGYSAADPVRMNYVANYIKPGPSSRNRTRAFSIGGETTVIFAKDNLLVDGDTRIEGGWELIAKGTEANRAERSFPHGAIGTQDPATAMVAVLDHGGASLPQRDAVDARLVEQFRESGGKIIDAPGEVGNWPLLEAGAAAVDSDRDGMPDAWETGRGLDPHDGSDHASKQNVDGFTNLEEYLNGLVRSPDG